MSKMSKQKFEEIPELTQFSRNNLKYFRFIINKNGYAERKAGLVEDLRLPFPQRYPLYEPEKNYTKLCMLIGDITYEVMMPIFRLIEKRYKDCSVEELNQLWKDPLTEKIQKDLGRAVSIMVKKHSELFPTIIDEQLKYHLQQSAFCVRVLRNDGPGHPRYLMEHFRSDGQFLRNALRLFVEMANFKTDGKINDFWKNHMVETHYKILEIEEELGFKVKGEEKKFAKDFPACIGRKRREEEGSSQESIV